MSQRAIIEADGIDVYYGSSQILFGLGVAVLEGQTTALLGRNGAGKTTTLKALAGLGRRAADAYALPARSFRGENHMPSPAPGSAMFPRIDRSFPSTRLRTTC